MEQMMRLTLEQESRIPEWVDKWIKIGLCTDEADWILFKSAAERCYEFAKLAKPRVIVQMQNPLATVLAGSIAAHLLSKNKNMGGAVNCVINGVINGAVNAAVNAALQAAVDDANSGTVYTAVSTAVGDTVNFAVGAAVRDAVYYEVSGPVSTAVAGAIRDAVGSAIYASVGVAVRDVVYGAVYAVVDGAVRDAVDGGLKSGVNSALRSAVGDTVDLRDGWYRYCGGQFWTEWNAYTSFFREVCRLQLPGDLWSRDLAYAQAQSSACWWWPHRDFIIVSNRPRRISLDTHGRLHDFNRLAIEFPDGWGVAAINGVRVPEHYVLTPADNIDVSAIFAEPNAQVRMAVISKVGFDRMASKLPTRLISKAQNTRGVDRDTQLLEFDLGNQTLVRGLRVHWKEKDGSIKETILGVFRTREGFGSDCPDNIDDAEQIRRWILRVPQDAQIVSEI